MSTTHQEKHGAYSSHQQHNQDGRETDKRALLGCASRLNIALQDGGKDMTAYAEAIRQNQRLWTIFQVAVCDPESELPRDLKITLLNLSRYVDRVSFRAITEFAPHLLNSLIEINRIIAGGLNKRPGDVPAATQTAAPAPAITPSGATAVMTTA